MAVQLIRNGTRIEFQEATEVIRPFLLFVFELFAGLARGLAHNVVTVSIPYHIVTALVYCTCPVSTVTNPKKLRHSSSLHLYPSISIKWRHWVSLSTFSVPCAVRANRIRFKYYVCVAVCRIRIHACPTLRRVSRSDKCQAQVHVGPDLLVASGKESVYRGFQNRLFNVCSQPQHDCAACWWFSPLGPVLGIPRCASKILKFLTLCIVVTAYTL
jgi:hypothetical protein